MSRSSGRAIRRHHTVRLKRNRKDYWGGREKSPGRLGMLVNTPAPCSCSMCCNERRNDWANSEERLTMQERRHDANTRV